MKEFYLYMIGELQSEKPWYSGLLILLFNIPLFLYLTKEPLLATFGLIDAFSIETITWTQLILSAIGIGIIILIMGRIELTVFRQVSDYESVITRAKRITYTMVVVHYLLIGTLFALTEQFVVVVDSLLSMIVVLISIKITVNLVSIDFKFEKIDKTEVNDDDLNGEK